MARKAILFATWHALLGLSIIGKAAENESRQGSHKEEHRYAVSCDLAVVGAGVGGAYAAYRASVAGRTVCVFEMSSRPGGRIHSLRHQGPRKDMVVEAGAYRFTSSRVCEEDVGLCIDTPLVRALVRELRLRVGIYNEDPKAWDYPMRKIVDKDGNDAGYLTIPETLLEKASSNGALVHYNTKVVGISGGSSAGDDDIKVAIIEDGGKEATVIAKAVLLNIAQGPVLELLRNSGAPFSEAFPEALYDPWANKMMKLYVHYDDAWWRNELGLKSGHFQNDNPSQNKTLKQAPAPLMGQYHDADVRCDLPDGRCRGFFQAFYSDLLPAVEFYEPYHNLVTEAAIELSPTRVEQKHLLKIVHEAMVEMHREALDAANATKKVEAMRPTAGVLSIWRGSVAGINAGCHSPKQGGHPSPGVLPDAALQPFPGMPVFVANEAYGPVNCWAEGSLNMSYRALEHLGIPQPNLEEPNLGEAPYPSPGTDPFFLIAARRRHASGEARRSKARGEEEQLLA